MKHPPCEHCGCQNPYVLARLVADMVVKAQAREERIEAELEADHVRGPLHDGSHPDCIVCAALEGGD